MTRNPGTDRRPAWLRWLLPHHRNNQDGPIADPFAPTSSCPTEQVQLRLGSGEWQPGSDLLSAKPRRETVPGNRPRFPTSRISAPQANQRLYPT